MTVQADDELRVLDAADRQRYEARFGDRLAGFLQYRAVPGRLILIHTEVDLALEGRGVAGRLAAAALDDIRARGLKATVKCPFVTAWMARHPEYEDLRAERVEAPGPDG